MFLIYKKGEKNQRKKTRDLLEIRVSKIQSFCNRIHPHSEPQRAWEYFYIMQRIRTALIQAVIIYRSGTIINRSVSKILLSPSLLSLSLHSHRVTVHNRSIMVILLARTAVEGKHPAMSFQLVFFLTTLE